MMKQIAESERIRLGYRLSQDWDNRVELCVLVDCSSSLSHSVFEMTGIRSALKASEKAMAILRGFFEPSP